MKKNQDNTTISNVSTDLIKKRRKRRVGYSLLGVVAIGLSVGAFFTLKHFGSALNHTSKFIECAETDDIHHHDDSCFSTDEYGYEILTCGYADYVVHKHNQYCYNDNDELICDLPEIEEHIHDDSCYEEVQILVCTIPEGEEIYDETYTDDYSYEEEYDDTSYEEDTYSDDSSDYIEDTSSEDIIIEDEPTPMAAAPHVHDDSCYETRRILTCGKLELHTHDDACFDEYGALICDIPQLIEHEHTEECVIKRELTDEEIAALDRADPNEKTQPKEHTLTYECPEYVVTVTYTDLANIPEGARLVVKEIKEDDAQYASIEKEVLGSQADSADKAKADADTETETTDADDDGELTLEEPDGMTIFKALDISFVFEGQEIEPEAEVKVDVKFLKNDFEDDDEITIHHITNDGTDVIGTQPIDESGEMSFTTESFSTFVVTKKQKAWDDPNPGFYQGRELRYNYMEDAFLTDQYAECRRANGAIGQYASNFHLVAFDTVYNNVHVNGNILAKNIAGWSNFGTNGFDHEVTYIQNLKTSPMMETGGHDKVVVVGSSTPVRAMNNVELWLGNVKAADCNGANLFIKDIDTNEAPFINLNNVRSEIDGIMNGFASQNTDVNVDVRLDKNYIRITNPDACGYANFKADQLRWKNDLKLIGFETGKKGSLIINVDCSGCDSFDIPTRAFIYFDAKVDAWGNVSGGRQGDTGEVTDFSDGKVIWNLLNCKEGMQVGITQMTGIALGPTCDFTINMMNGNVVGRNITITGETHRTDFTGTTVPFSAKFHATKTVDGSAPAANQSFEFELLEYWDGKWDHRQTVKSKGSNINFSDIQFDCSKRPWEEGDHYYMIREIPGSNKTITYDKSAFLFHVKVNYANGVTSATYDNYRRADYSDNLSPTAGSAIDGAEAMAFDNKTSTEISVAKEWVDADGVSAYSEDLPDSITVSLYQAKGDGNGIKLARPDATVELKKSENYTHTWKELPREDGNGAQYSYYIVEHFVPGFKLVSEQVRKTDGTITLKNQKEPRKTSVSVDKKFFIGDKQVINPAVTTDDNNAYVEFRLMYSADGGNTWHSHDHPTSVHPQGGSGTYRLDASNGWHLEIGNLPAEGTETGSYCKYTYKVVETESTFSAFTYKYSVASDRVEIGRPEDSKVTGGVLADGTYSFEIADYSDDTTTVEINKYWFTVKGDEDSIQYGANENVVINLRLTNGENVDEYYQMSYDKFVAVDSNGNTTASKYEISNVEKWSAKISGLPKYYVTDAGSLAIARYQIEEQAIDEEGHTFDEYVADAPIYNDDDPGTRVVTLNNRNTVTYDLPATGGRGTVGGAVTKWLNGHLN